MMQDRGWQHEWRFVATWLLVLGGIEALLGLQGFCMADEGWSLTGYQQIFDEPESVKYIFLFYNALWIGGIWETLFGGMGIYGFRLLGIMFMLMTWVALYLTLRRHISRWAFVVGALLVVFAHNYGVMVFDHSSVTILLVALSVLFLMRALTTHSGIAAMMFGVCIGINIFSRIPNLSQLALLLLFIPYYIFHKRVSTTLRLTGMSLLGIVAGMVLMVSLMATMGHLGIFVDNLQSGFSAASAGDSSHNLTALASTYGAQYIQVVKDMLKVAVPPLLLVGFDNMMFLYAFCTLILLISLWTNRHDAALTYLTWAALIVLYTLPFGSDFGINNMGENAIWMAAPLAVGLGWQLVGRLQRWWRWYTAVVLTGFCFVFIVMNGIQMSHNAYFDPGARTAKTYRINSRLATTLTSARYKESTDCILTELSKYVSAGDRLFCFQNRPMLHYLTHTRPYMHNPWPWSYDTAMMEQNLRDAERRTKAQGEPWPVLVREKCQTIDFTEPDTAWNSTDATDDFAHKNAKVALIQEFISRNNYSVVWENDEYQILMRE